MFPCEPTNLSLKCHPAELRGLCIKGICDGSNTQVITTNNPLTVIMTFEALIKHKINKSYKVIKISKLEMMWYATLSVTQSPGEGRRKHLYTIVRPLQMCSQLGKERGLSSHCQLRHSPICTSLSVPSTTEPLWQPLPPSYMLQTRETSRWEPQDYPSGLFLP